jgi:hypothetical protein
MCVGLLPSHSRSLDTWSLLAPVICVSLAHLLLHGTTAYMNILGKKEMDVNAQGRLGSQPHSSQAVHPDLVRQACRQAGL